MKTKNKSTMSFIKKLIILALIVILLGYTVMWLKNQRINNPEALSTLWQFRAVDTMKLSRDKAKEKLSDSSYDAEIEQQVKNISDVGATHIAIATPYDEEFLPYLKRWVSTARKYHLKVWFRGNWSNWEGWFGYDKQMTFAEHIQKTTIFIKNHPDLFEEGDAFTGCPECENGAQGDPRQTGKVDQYRHFLIDEHIQMAQAFASIHKNVNTSLMSMNKDVADLIMDQPTAAGVGGFVTIDHYVKDPSQLVKDVDALAAKTKAKIVLGEFGAPIPDLHGNLSADDQAKWIDQVLKGLANTHNLYGLSYWTNEDGSTAIWNDAHAPKPAVDILAKYYMPRQVFGSIKDELGFPIDGVMIEANGRQYQAKDGEYLIPIYGYQTVNFKKTGYDSKSFQFQKDSDQKEDIILKNQNPSEFYSFWANIRRSIFPN